MSTQPEATAAQSTPAKTSPSWGYIVVPFLLCSLAVLPSAFLHGDIGGGIAYIVGMLFIPALIGFLVRGRKGDWKGFSRWFFWLGILLPALAFVGRAAH